LIVADFGCKEVPDIALVEVSRELIVSVPSAQGTGYETKTESVAGMGSQMCHD
jgi:hypothetical protein